MSIRKSALQNPSDEFNKIAEVIGRYAIHNSGKAFSLKKHGEGNSHIITLVNNTTRENIRSIYGGNVAKELIDFEVDDSKLKFKAKGLISNANYSIKKCTFLLFINNRLVESSPMRKCIESVYAAYLPKHMHPFLYLSLDILPQNVDVNVHPTKHEVRFLYESEIFEKLQQAVDSRLLGANTSRSFLTQTLLPSAPVLPIELSKESSSSKAAPDKEKKIYDRQLVRTDCKERKIEAFFSSPHSNSPFLNKDEVITDKEEDITDKYEDITDKDEDITDKDEDITDKDEDITDKEVVSEEQPTKVDTRLESVLELRKGVEDRCHTGLRDILQNNTFAGCVDQKYALFQHSTKLYIANTHELSKELFYQLMLKSFGNFDALRLSNPAPIKELAMIALDSEDSGWVIEMDPKEELAQNTTEILKSKAPILDAYFSMEIDQEGNLLTLPHLLDNYSPPLQNLPMLVVRLAADVEWKTEKECFETLCREIALFYAVPEKSHLPAAVEEEKSAMKWTIEHVIYTAVKQHLKPPTIFSTDASILQIANLPDLYKVFERC